MRLSNTLLAIGLVLGAQVALAAPPAPARKALVSQAAAIERGRKLIEEKKFKAGGLYFYNLVYGNSRMTAQQKQLSKYLMGVALNRANFSQIASFNLLASSQSTDRKLASKSYEQLVKAAEALNDKSLLNYAFKKTDVTELTEIGREYYFNSLAKISMEAGENDKAISYLDNSLTINSENEESIYLKGLAYIKKGDNASAVPFLEKIYKKYEPAPLASKKKDEATLALARVNYNLQKWTAAIELYKTIPKDSHLYRQVNLELSWAYFRNYQFRSALSVIHSLNTPFYENFYDPESLILRSIILLFICQVPDLERSVAFFNNYYVAAYDNLKFWNQNNYSDQKHFAMVDKLMGELNRDRNLSQSSVELPYFIFRTLLEDPEISMKISYLNNIKRERKALNAQFNVPNAMNFLKYGNKILDSRIKNVSAEVGSLVKLRLRDIENELADYITQFDFINYETIGIMKNKAAQKFIKKSTDVSEADDKQSRQFFIQSGFQYYPFEGEYWRDEIGNYQYLGTNQCGAND